jgi:transcriptional regulator with XRE-family HTH domain
MTQESLAEAVGVSTSTIQRWEYGEMAPEFDRLEILAKALNRKTEDFFKDLGI